MEKLKERLTILLSKEKLLNKPQEGNNFSFEMQRMTTCLFKPTQLPKTPITNNKSKHKF